MHTEGPGLCTAGSGAPCTDTNTSPCPAPGQGTLRSRSSKQFPQNKSLFPSSKRLQGQPRSCTSTRRDRVQLHAFLFYFSILFFKFGDCCKLCLQLRLLGNSSPRTTIAVISLLLLGRLTFSFLPLIFWLEFQHKV